jgi:hypothetical protein
VADVVHSIVHEGDDPLPLLDALLSVAEAEDDLEFLFFLAAGLIEDVIVDRSSFATASPSGAAPTGHGGLP